MGLGGLGSRGGKIIGYTKKSGKAIYDTAARVFRGAKQVNYVSAAKQTGTFGATLGVGSGIATIPSAIAANVYSQARYKTLGPKLEEDFKRPDQVNSKATIHGLAKFKNVTVINSRKELLANEDLTDYEKAGAKAKGSKLYYPTEDAEFGRNAFAYKSDSGKEFIISSKTVNKQVIGHELGHIVDFRKGGLDQNDRDFTGVFMGRELASETRAWDYSPFKGKKDEPLRTDALDSYKVHRNNARIYGIGTAAGGLAFAVALRKLGVR